MFTGLDVDKATISVAVAQGKRGGEVRYRGRCRTGTSSNLGSSIGGADLAPRMGRCWESRGCRQAPPGCRACRRLRRRQRRHEAQGVG
ncbi:hypothetical protein E2978_04030 (plasmid) [Paracoccus yeei]